MPAAFSASYPPIHSSGSAGPVDPPGLEDAMQPAPPLSDFPDIETVDLLLPPEVRPVPAFERDLTVQVREPRLLTSVPWVRSLGKLPLEVTTQGRRFPTPPESLQPADLPDRPRPAGVRATLGQGEAAAEPPGTHTRLVPPREAVLFKDRLLYLLQPALENLFAGKQLNLPFQPYPYQMKGIAFLMPRDAALLADDMGLGKTAQSILAMRLLFHGGFLHRALVVCPKPLVINWTRELKMWAPDLPFEVVGGDTETRRAQWTVSNCPLKLVNYELLTRDAGFVTDEAVSFDLVILDEAQRIKSRESKTSQVARALNRRRSWAMSGTPVENRADDLVNLFAFIDPQRIPADTPPGRLPDLVRDSILRRTKEEAAPDMPPRIYRDSYLELTPAQRESYDLAENEGVVRLNALGATLTVQHVFELVMRLKQICNFDPATGASAKLEQLSGDVAEVAACNRKAIIFSQWVEPLEVLAKVLAPHGPLLYHGRVPHPLRQPILDQFRADPTRHVILMSYGTGSVGLNLQFANYVFLFDRWWNPAVEDQAIN